MRNLGIFSLLIVLAFAVILILNVWGIFPINLLTLGRLGITMVIVGLVAGFAFAIYAMFMWKGNEKHHPSSSKEKEAMRQNRSSDM